MRMLMLSLIYLIARLKERHGGWAPGSTAAVGYVHESVANALMVPQALSL